MNRIQSMNIKQEHMKVTKFHGLILMTKCIFKTIDKTDQLLVIKVNCKKRLSLQLFQKSFFDKHIVIIFILTRTVFFFRHIVRLLSWHIKFEKCKEFEQLMPVAWHPENQWNFCRSKDEKKKQNRFLLSNAFNVFNFRVLEHYVA